MFTLLASAVYAVGSGEIPRASPSPTIEEKKIDCDSLSLRVDRIKCRLKYGAKEENVDYDVRVPEACRTLRNPTACIALYKNVQQNRCYEKTVTEKDRCFKTLVGFSGNKTEESARNYMILLLYGIEERIEDANEAGTVSDDKAAEIIDLIVDIKQDILDGKKRADIVIKLNELRQKLGSIK